MRCYFIQCVLNIYCQFYQINKIERSYRTETHFVFEYFGLLLLVVTQHTFQFEYVEIGTTFTVHKVEHFFLILHLVLLHIIYNLIKQSFYFILIYHRYQFCVIKLSLFHNSIIKRVIKMTYVTFQHVQPVEKQDF